LDPIIYNHFNKYSFNCLIIINHKTLHH
jgi:hypothetical protein